MFPAVISKTANGTTTPATAQNTTKTTTPSVPTAAAAVVIKPGAVFLQATTTKCTNMLNNNNNSNNNNNNNNNNNKSGKIVKHELRYLPIATMPTKQSNIVSIGHSNSQQLQQQQQHMITTGFGATATTSMAPSSNATLNIGTTTTGLIQFVPTTHQIAPGIVGKNLLPALAILTPGTTLVPATTTKALVSATTVGTATPTTGNVHLTTTAAPGTAASLLIRNQVPAVTIAKTTNMMPPSTMPQRAVIKHQQQPQQQHTKVTTTFSTNGNVVMANKTHGTNTIVTSKATITQILPNGNSVISKAPGRSCNSTTTTTTTTTAHSNPNDVVNNKAPVIGIPKAAASLALTNALKQRARANAANQSRVKESIEQLKKYCVKTNSVVTTLEGGANAAPPLKKISNPMVAKPAAPIKITTDSVGENVDDRMKNLCMENAKTTTNVSAGTSTAPPLAKIVKPVVSTQQQQKPEQKQQSQQPQQKLKQLLPKPSATKCISIQSIDTPAEALKKLKQVFIKNKIAVSNSNSSSSSGSATMQNNASNGTKTLPVALLDQQSNFATIKLTPEANLLLNQPKRPKINLIPAAARKSTPTVSNQTPNDVNETQTLLLAALNAASKQQQQRKESNNSNQSKEDSQKLLAQRLQRSKSLNNGNEQTDAMGRRHSVAVMAKDKDLVTLQQNIIDTITISDDDVVENFVKVAAKVANVTNGVDKKLSRSASNDTDDVTIVESINCIDLIDEDDEDELKFNNNSKTSNKPVAAEPHINQSATKNNLSIVKAETLLVSKDEFEKSLLCDEIISSTKTSPSSSNTSLNCTTPTTAPITSNSTNVTKVEASSFHTNSNSRSLLAKPATHMLTKYTDPMKMQSCFSMLKWREKIGHASNSKMRFDLNNFCLLQMRESCEARQGPANYFERPLFERTERRLNKSEYPLLYLCKRCNCHGPALEFLSHNFCSLACLRRNSIKRKFVNNVQQERDDRKHRRMETNSASLIKRPFRWSEYLQDKSQGQAAPIHLFFNAFPFGPNYFELGMKLEAIDPENCSLFCVCTIVEVRGYRLKINFDGYQSLYDFWINADSMDIFPPGWCKQTKRTLQPPLDYKDLPFDWERYLKNTNTRAAPWQLFTHLNSSAMPLSNPFKIGMHLEAEDLNDTGKICVATIADVLDERVRVHFDGWDDCYDFWVHISSPYIHPCGWHEGRQQLIVPPDYNHTVFKWAKYIGEVGGIAADQEFFQPREPMDFKANMKLEVVDQRNPCLIRPATVVTRKGYRVQLHLDCWPAEYFFWLEDDSPDLHPIGWCEATSYELEAPPGFQSRPAQMPCDVDGCRGYGNAKRFHLNVHALRDCCPYAPENWRTKIVKPTRVQHGNIQQANNAPHIQKLSQEPKKQSQTLNLKEDKTVSRKQSVLSVKEETNASRKQRLIPLKEEKTVQKKQRKSPEKLETAVPLKKQNESKQSQQWSHTSKIKLEPLENNAATSPPSTSGLDNEKIDDAKTNIAKKYIADYGERFVRNYNLWQQNCNFNMSTISTNPMYWTKWDVFEYLERTLNSEEIAKLIFDEDIDGRSLLSMCQEDLIEMLGLKLGPAVTLFSTIINLRCSVFTKFNTDRIGLNVLEMPVPSKRGRKRKRK